MGINAGIVLGVIIVMIFALIKDWFRPGLIFASVIFLFMAFDIISYQDALAGFSNKSMITVAILFLVSEGVRQSGALDYLASILLPRKQRPIPRLLLVIMAPIALISAFLNNTPVVIIFAPVIRKWAENIRLPASKFLIPLSYATILGGLCTLMGTSTNLVVDGMMRDAGFHGLGMFELFKVGGFVLLVGFIYIIVFGNLLLPGKWIRGEAYGDAEYKDYYFEVRVVKGGDLVGQQIVKGHNDFLAGFTVKSIHSAGTISFAHENNFILKGDEILTLVGRSDGLQYLLDKPYIELTFKDNMPKDFWGKDKKQIEVVLAPRFQGIGKTLASFDFFNQYGAIVIAIHRNGETLTSNLAQVTMREGDNLVLIANDKFQTTWARSRVFYMTSYVGEYAAPKSFHRMWFALAVLIVMVLGVVFGDRIHIGSNKIDMFFMASLAAVVMIWTKLLPAREYTKAISWDVLITIACAFGIALAMQRSGLANEIAEFVIKLFTGKKGVVSPTVALGIIYLITSLFTELITNNAAAALSFPIALALAQQLGVDPRPFFIAICISASASFSTPIGYQTNLIVQGIGNYKFKDYLRIGLPLNLLCFMVSIYIIPLFWKF